MCTHTHTRTHTHTHTHTHTLTHTHTHSHTHTGLSHQELLEELQKRKKAKVDPHTGKIFAYVYTSEDTRFQIVQKVVDMFEFEGKNG